MRKVVTILCLATTLVAPSWAAGEVVLFGAVVSCGKWLESRQTPSLFSQYRQWIFGFVSGINWETSGPQARPPDFEAAVAFVDGYCRNNPPHSIALAGAALVQETGGSKALHEWKR